MKYSIKAKQIVIKMQENLNDLCEMNGKPMCIYNAYKMHVLTSGIQTLEILAKCCGPHYHLINELLERYRAEVNKLLFNI